MKLLVEVQNVQSEAEKTRAWVTAELNRIECQLEELHTLSTDSRALHDRLRDMRKMLSNIESEAETLKRQLSGRSGGHYFDKEYEAARNIKDTFTALRSNAGSLRAEIDSAVDRARAHLQEQERLKREIASLEADLDAEYFADAKGQAAGLNAAKFCANYEIDASQLDTLRDTINQLKAQVYHGDLFGANAKLEAANETWRELKLLFMHQAETVVDTYDQARIFQKVLKELGFEYQAEWGEIAHQTLRIKVRGRDGDITITKDRDSPVAFDTPHHGCATLMCDVQNAALRHGVQIKRVDSQPETASHPQPKASPLPRLRISEEELVANRRRGAEAEGTKVLATKQGDVPEIEAVEVGTADEITILVEQTTKTTTEKIDLEVNGEATLANQLLRATGRLVENIPRRMRVGVPEAVEIRMGREELTPLLISGLTGTADAKTHAVEIIESMSVGLFAPLGGFEIGGASPTTQIVDAGAASAVHGRWLWMVTPLRRGHHRLQICVSAQVKTKEGLPAHSTLPDQIIEIEVIVNYKYLAVQSAMVSSGAIVSAFLGAIVSDKWPTIREFVGALFGK